MGMDVHGLHPRSAAGQYFRNSVWSWRPLADYCCEIGKDLIANPKGWQYNKGHSLDGNNAAKLATRLEAEISSGRTASYEMQHKRAIELTPDEDCETCGGTGRRVAPPRTGPGDQLCNGCNGKGSRRPYSTWYSFEVDNVRKFAEFLKDCGGFEIW